MNAVARGLAIITVTAALCGVFVGAAHAGAASAPTGVSLSVQAGYPFSGGGFYRVAGPTLQRAADAWVPIRVTLRNDGGSEVDGRLDISDSTAQPLNNLPPAQADYTLDVTLPAGAHKMVEMYMRGADLGSPFAVNFTVGRGIVASSSINPNPQTPGTLSAGVLSDDTSTRTMLRSLKLGDTSVSVTQFNDAIPLDPQPQALLSFDLIVLANYSSDTLSAPQVDALRAWVQGGGVLLEAGGPDAQKTLSHLPPDLQAAVWQPSSTSVQLVPALPELARVSGHPAGSTGPAEVSVATARPGATVLAGHAGIPLLVDMPLGRGHVVYSALEPALAPFAAWPQNVQNDFWQHALGQALAGPLDAQIQAAALSSGNGGGGAPSSNQTSISDDLQNLPAHELPSLQVYTFLIVLYILVLGPANFFLLRYLRRLELSWITIPVIAVAFGVTSFALAYQRNGGDVLANIDTVVYLDSGGPSKLSDAYVGIFAPYQADFYTLSSPGPALAWSLDTSSGSGSGLLASSRLMRVDEGSPFTAWIYGLQMWSMRTVAVRQQINLPGQVQGNLTLHGNLVSGDVTNDTGVTLYDCAVVAANGSSAPIGMLAPHQTARLQPFALSTASGVSGAGNSPGPLSNLYAGLVGPATGLNAAGARALQPPTRYTNVLGALFPSGTLATAVAPLTLIGWSTQPVSQFTVNGSAPRRSDLVLFVAPLGLSAASGRISMVPGAVPVNALGTDATSVSNSGGALMLNPGNHLDLQLALPVAGHHVSVQTLSVQINTQTGSSLGPGDAKLWNWVTQRWQAIDLSTGFWSHHHAGSLASPDGRIRLRLEPAQSSISLNSLSQNVGIGATAMVTP